MNRDPLDEYLARACDATALAIVLGFVAIIISLLSGCEL